MGAAEVNAAEVGPPHRSLNLKRTDGPVLSVEDLRVAIRGRKGDTYSIVDGVSFTVARGESLALVGESGCGKTISMLAILGLLPQTTRWEVSGKVHLGSTDLLGLRSSQLRQVRGRDVGMIFQNPTSSLNPVVSVGAQIGEAIKLHNPGMEARKIRSRVIDLLETVGISEPRRRYDQYPFEFSGGMAQRAMIAMALANQPSLVIADEPTTALDVTVQAQIVEVLRDALVEHGTSLIMITHNLGLVSEIASRVVVMYAGRIMESGSTSDIFNRQRHPYTAGLMRSLPSLRARQNRLEQIPGRPPSALDRPSGCPFHPRCFLRRDRSDCVTSVPPITTLPNSEHATACHHWAELDSDWSG